MMAIIGKFGKKIYLYFKLFYVWLFSFVFFVWVVKRICEGFVVGASFLFFLVFIVDLFIIYTLHYNG